MFFLFEEVGLLSLRKADCSDDEVLLESVSESEEVLVERSHDFDLERNPIREKNDTVGFGAKRVLFGLTDGLGVWEDESVD